MDDDCLRHPWSLKGVVRGLGRHQSWGVGLRKTPETVTGQLQLAPPGP